MRNLTILLLLIPLASCSQWCDCQPAETASNQHSHVEKEANTTLADEMQSEQIASSEASRLVGSSGLEVVHDRPMQEATPVTSINQPSQFEQLMAEPNAKPIMQLSAGRLQRRPLPSESGQFYEAYPPASPYPQLKNSRKELIDYAAQAAFKLAGFEALRGAKIGVASFVEFDSSLQQTTAVGNQFAEAMVSLLPQYGVDVIEYKLTKSITVGPSGDLALSRNIKALQANVGMDYILTGTVIATKRGLQIHSRVVSVGQHKVIAATSTLIPHLVLQQIQP